MSDLSDDLRALVARMRDPSYWKDIDEWADELDAILARQATPHDLQRERDLYNMVQHHRPPSTPPMTREALEEAERQSVAMRHEDYDWALERVTRMCASALVDARINGTKLLKGFGYPDEIMCRAQDFRALSIVLDAIKHPHGWAAPEADRQGGTTPRRSQND